MIGLDANVLARYIMQDEPKQAALATQLIESLSVDAPGFVPLVSLIELAWILSAAYELGRDQLVEALEGLLRTKELHIERAEIVWKALRAYQNTNAQFADCLIERSAAAAGCEKTMTFDREAVQHGGMSLLG